MVARPSIAIIGPKFFSYMDEIVRAIEGRGLRVVFLDERHSNSVPAKIGYRTGVLNRFSKVKREHLENVSRKVVQDGFTDALLVDTEVCDRPFVETLRASGVRTHLYMWDSSRNKPTFVSFLDQVQTKMSFDPVDSRGYDMIYEPLFASSDYVVPEREQRRVVDLYFCGTLHSDRARWIVYTRRVARQRDLTFLYRLYYHSKVLLALKGLVQLANFRLLGSISTTGWTREQIALECRQALAVLDVPHPGQNGLTMRTFEALQAGALLITTNPHAKDLPHRLGERVIVICDGEEIVGIDFRALAQLPPLSVEQRYFLSVERFVDRILFHTGISAMMPKSVAGT